MAALERALDVLSAAAAPPPPPGTWGWGRWDGTHVILEDDPDGTPLLAENATGRLVPGQRVYCRTGGKRAVIIGPEAPAVPSATPTRGWGPNGTWWRDPHGGLQICWLDRSSPSGGNTTPYTPGLYLAGTRWQFPLPFSEPPSVTVGRFQLSTGASWPTSHAGVTATYADLRCFDSVARADVAWHLQATAVGLYR